MQHLVSFPFFLEKKENKYSEIANKKEKMKIRSVIEATKYFRLERDILWKTIKYEMRNGSIPISANQFSSS